MCCFLPYGDSGGEADAVVVAGVAIVAGIVAGATVRVARVAGVVAGVAAI